MNDNTTRHHSDPQPQADFYLGRGTNATYLGTTILAHEQIRLDLLRSLTEDEYTETDYLRAVAAMTGNPHLPDQHAIGDPPLWPHEHADSTETPWTYCYDSGTVYVYRYGVEMLQIRCNTHRWSRRRDGTAKPIREWRPVNDFPAMYTEERAGAEKP